MLYYLDDGFKNLPLRHQKDIYIFASNYCIARVRKESGYLKELMNLYRRVLENGIIYEKDEISEFDYKNIVTLGSATKEFDWTERFIEDNRDRLPAAKRDNAYALNKARFLYSLGRLEGAAQLLATVTDSDVVYHLARVILEVRIAYDQQDQEYALNLLETFRLYVRRNRKMSTKDKRSYINYTRFTKSLVNLKQQKDFMAKEAYSKKVGTLNTTVGEVEFLVERTWLLEESRG
jgi:hypothetical protein